MPRRRTQHPCAHVLILLFFFLLSIVMAAPVAGDASSSSRVTVIRFDPTTQQRSSSCLGRLRELVMGPKAKLYLWACSDDSTMGWCGTDHGGPAGGREVAIVILASALIVTAVCIYFSR